MLFTALFVPLGFFLLRDTIAAITGIMFESIGGKESFLYQINDDIARLIIVGLLMLIMPIFFRGKCNFGFRGGKLKLGILLALPELIVPLWNFCRSKYMIVVLLMGMQQKWKTRFLSAATTLLLTAGVIIWAVLIERVI